MVTRADGGPELQARLSTLAELIATAPVNLVSRGERECVGDVHIAECLQVGPQLPGLKGAGTWLDLGTGGGLPGLVLAMAFPQVEWVLLDSVQKKARLVEEFARTLVVENVTVVCDRAEALARKPGYRERFDGVVARGVAPLVVLVELARGFTVAGGWLAAVKGPGWRDELEASRWACRTLGWGDVQAERVPSTARPTWLVTMRAAGPAPRRFPRATGVPARRPLLGPRPRSSRSIVDEV